MSKITFKLIPTKTTKDKSTYLVRIAPHRFFSVEIKGEDYEAELKKALREEFGNGCTIARSIWVENTEEGLNIYTIVSYPDRAPINQRIKCTSGWYKQLTLDELFVENFDEYDRAFIRWLRFREDIYTTSES